MIIDTHCHLDSLPSSYSFLAQYSEFSQYHVSPLFVTMGVSPNNWPTVIQLAADSPLVYPALGIHPWYVEQVDSRAINLLESYLSQYPVVALGEIGLDFSDKYQASKARQLDVLSQQLALATRFNKPLSIHVIKAHNELYEMLRSKTFSGVIHGLGSSLEVAQKYVDCGFKIGVNGILLRSNARRYHELVRFFGLEHLVLESDAPNIILPGHSTTQLIDIYAVALQVADLLQVSKEEVLETTSENAYNLFRFDTY